MDVPKELIWEAPHDRKVYRVDGRYVREHYWLDFVMGGHHARYVFIPKKEIWIDDGLRKDEEAFVIVHEYVESELMDDGWPYEDAHFQASVAELQAREVLKDFKMPDIAKMYDDLTKKPS